MSRSLFLPVFLGAALCLGGAAQAQQKDERIERILHPDLNQSFNLSMQKKFGSNAYDSRTSRVVGLKTLAEPHKYDIKSFLTGSYRGDKSFWMGDFKYSTSDANTHPRTLFSLPGKSFGTKVMAVKSAAGSDKDYATGTAPGRDFRGGGAFASAKDREKLKTALTPEQAATNGFQGDLHELKSINDVRDLLNKSK